MNFPGTGLPGGGARAPNGMDMTDPNVKRVQALMESCFAKSAMSGVAGFGLGGIFGMFMASMAYDTPFHTPGTTGPAPTGPGGAGPAGPAATAGKPAAAAGSAASSATLAKALPKTTAPSLATTAAAAPAATGASAAATGASAAAALDPLAGISSLPLRQQLAHGFRDMGSRSYSTAKNFGTVGALYAGIECGIEGLRAKNDLANGVTAGCLTGAILARNGGPQAAAIGCAGFAAFSAAIDAYMRMPPSDD